MKKLSLVLFAVFLTTGIQAALTTTLGSDADTWVRAGSGSNYGGDTGMYLLDNAGRVGYVRFDLSSLGAATIQSATLTLTKVTGTWGRNDAMTTGRFALVGLENIEGNTAQNWGETALTSGNVGSEFIGGGAEPIDLTKVTNLDMDDLGIDVSEAISGNVMTVTGNALVAFLQSRVNDGGLATFIAALPGTSGKGYWLATKENATAEYHPMLQITYIPEPATMLILGLGGLLALRKKQ